MPTGIPPRGITGFPGGKGLGLLSPAENGGELIPGENGVGGPRFIYQSTDYTVSF